MVARKTRKHGVDRLRLETVSTEDGQVILSQVQDVLNVEHWDNVHGKAFARGIVMHATDGGVVKEDLATGQLTTLPGTDKYVTGDDSLDRIGGGVVVIKDGSVISIEPKK